MIIKQQLFTIWEKCRILLMNDFNVKVKHLLIHSEGGVNGEKSFWVANLFKHY